MKFLFIFAHPDDETVACSATIAQLVAAGHQVTIISVTKGEAGEAPEWLIDEVEKSGGLGRFRTREFMQVCELLGVSDYQILDYADGELTNNLVWGKLKQELSGLIDSIKPDVLITFDHAGWYYHLDHVGVSIATTWAFHQAKHQTPLLLFSLMPIASGRWQYVFSPKVMVDYKVKVPDTKLKLTALGLHRSQSLETVKKYIEFYKPHAEYYQVAFTRSQDSKILRSIPIFAPLKHAIKRKIIKF